nr:MAG TPA: Protein of unknown function (DUF1382) [Caudoviricetes sp.]
MNKASPVELRKSLEMANALASSGIRFVPVPVINDAVFNRLVDESRKIIDSILTEAEMDATNQQFESLSNHKHHFINGTCVECLKSE